MSPLEFAQGGFTWEWGVCDCTLFCATWVFVETGKDPGDGLRSTYSTAAAANAIVDRAGGMEAFIGQRLEGCGFARCIARKDGDIGLVEVPTGISIDNPIVKIVPAIAWGPLWVAMAARGPVIKQMVWTEAAWRIE